MPRLPRFAGRMRHLGRPLLGLLVALALVYAQQFLTVHSLQHLFEADSSHCEYAPLAAAAGGGAVHYAAPVLMPPPPVAAEYPAPRRLNSETTPPARRARAPPLA
jgi:hypothetical protein